MKKITLLMAAFLILVSCETENLENLDLNNLNKNSIEFSDDENRENNFLLNDEYSKNRDSQYPELLFGVKNKNTRNFNCSLIDPNRLILPEYTAHGSASQGPSDCNYSQFSPPCYPFFLRQSITAEINSQFNVNNFSRPSQTQIINTSDYDLFFSKFGIDYDCFISNFTANEVYQFVTCELLNEIASLNLPSIYSNQKYFINIDYLHIDHIFNCQESSFIHIDYTINLGTWL